MIKKLLLPVVKLLNRILFKVNKMLKEKVIWAIIL